MENKRFDLAEGLLEVVDEDRLNDILKQIDKAEEGLAIKQEVPKEVVSMMKDKPFHDIIYTIIALSQLLPVYALNSIYNTLGYMLKTCATKELGNITEAKAKEIVSKNE